MDESELSREALAALPPDILDSPLFNADLAPVPPSRRNWTTYNFAALWISMAHCIPTYMLAGGLVAVGMNWWQALLTIGLGNLIVLGPILLNAHPGTRYGIPFPVLARASFGTTGANVPALLRALVACGWFGIQAYIGGEAVRTFLDPRSARARGDHLPRLLVPEHLHHLSRDERRADLRELGRAARARDGARPPRLDGGSSAGVRDDARRALAIHLDGGFRAGLREVAHRDGRLLGDARAQHPGLHALRQGPEGADGRPGVGPADDHDRVLRHRRDGHQRGPIRPLRRRRQGAVEVRILPEPAHVAGAA